MVTSAGCTTFGYPGGVQLTHLKPVGLPNARLVTLIAAGAIFVTRTLVGEKTAYRSVSAYYRGARSMANDYVMHYHMYTPPPRLPFTQNLRP